MFQKGANLAAMLAVSRYNYPVVASYEVPLVMAKQNSAPSTEVSFQTLAHSF